MLAVDPMLEIARQNSAANSVVFIKGKTVISINVTPAFCGGFSAAERNEPNFALKNPENKCSTHGLR